MIELLDNFLPYWLNWMFISFGFGIIGFGFLVYSKFVKSKRKKNSFKIGIILFSQTFLSWLIGFGILLSVPELARKELITLLNQSDLKVMVNDQFINLKKSDIVIFELKKIENLSTNQTFKSDDIKIDILSKDKCLNLILKQDSEHEDVYWIFVVNYEITKKNEIGRINSDIKKIINSS